MYVCVCMYIYIYIYILKQIHQTNTYIYIYIYIYVNSRRETATVAKVARVTIEKSARMVVCKGIVYAALMPS